MLKNGHNILSQSMLILSMYFNPIIPCTILPMPFGVAFLVLSFSTNSDSNFSGTLPNLFLSQKLSKCQTYFSHNCVPATRESETLCHKNTNKHFRSFTRNCKSNKTRNNACLNSRKVKYILSREIMFPLFSLI